MNYLHKNLEFETVEDGEKQLAARDIIMINLNTNKQKCA